MRKARKIYINTIKFGPYWMLSKNFKWEIYQISLTFVIVFFKFITVKTFYIPLYFKRSNKEALAFADKYIKHLESYGKK